MKFRFTSLLTLSLLAALTCCHEKSLFPDLDEALGKRNEIRREHALRIERLKCRLETESLEERASIADSLRLLYERVFPDSAYLYAKKAVEYRSGLDDRRELLLSRLNMLRDATSMNVLTSIEEFLAIDTSTVKDYGLTREYLACGLTLSYSARKGMSENRDSYDRLYRKFFRQYCQIDSTSADYVFFTAREKRDQLKYEEVVDFLLPYCTESPFKCEEMSVLTAYLAYVYRYLDMPDEAEKWYEKSATNDILSAKHQNMSLAQLARLLSNRGEQKLAIKYVTIANEDAELYNDTGRIALISPILSTISESSLKSERRMREVGMVSSIVIFILLVVVVISMHKVVVASAKLRTLNRNISRINKELADVNMLKDNYMAKYMIKCTGYINEVDKRTSEIRRILKKEGPEGLTAELHKPKYSDSELKSFYTEFDRTFLALFPGFLEKVNKRVVCGEPWKMSRSNTMPMELRIIAATRIGIKDNAEIAAFLNFPPASIYTYRYRLKTSFGLERMDLKEFVESLEI